MADWFVLLIPLLLVPIFMLFAFTGCVLDREGTAPSSPVQFVYTASLDVPFGEAPALSSIRWEYTMELDSDLEFGGPGQIGGSSSAGPFRRGAGSDDPILTGGEIVPHMVQLDTYGPVTCSCTLVTQANPPFDEQTHIINLVPFTKQKREDEIGPRFTVVRSGSGFILV